MTYRILVLALALVLATPAIGLAHKGHDHKLMGTVTMVAPDHVMMKTIDGKQITVTVNAKTKVLKGKTAVKLTDVTEGTRVVMVVASDKAPFTASVITVGATADVPSKARKQ